MAQDYSAEQCSTREHWKRADFMDDITSRTVEEQRPLILLRITLDVNCVAGKMRGYEGQLGQEK